MRYRGRAMIRRSRCVCLAVLPLAGLIAACTVDREFQPGPQHLTANLRGIAPGAAGAPDSLLVVSYNIQYGERLADALADLRAGGLDRPDILLLQEMTPAGVETLAAALRLNYVYQPASVHPHHQQPFGNAVLSRWPILAQRLLVLPHAQPWTGQRRVAVACDLDVAGQPLSAISLHLATPVVSAERRLAQAAAVLDSLVAGWHGPVVLGGDFNTAMTSEVAAVRRYYRRAGRLLPARLPPGCTIRWQPGRLVDAGCRLDHLFLRGLQAGASGITRDATASDHFPIWVRTGRPVPGASG